MSHGMLGALGVLRRTLRSPFLSFSIRSLSHEERLYQTDMYLKRNGRVSLEGFQDLRTASKITPDRALLLFRCCGSLLPDITPSKRHELMLELKSRFKTPFIDISHYNTLLLVQNENGIPFDPSEALAELESMGLEPNRVTYQHLIERYALQGDLQATNTILSHMKEAGMPINEWIFGSLITCHCLKGDLEGAKGVMDVMKQSGLDVGSEAHITYIMGVLKHRSKDITKQEIASLFEDAKFEEINFCDHDIFQVLARASSLDRIDLAEEIVSYLPRKSGYYQEMRNNIPGLIFNGHIKVALSLFQDFASNIQQDDTGLSKRVAGEFIPIAMVRSNGRYTAKEIEETVDSLLSNDLGYIFAETMAACIEEGHEELGKALGAIIQSRRLFDRKDFISYIKRKARAIADKDDRSILQSMSHLVSSLVKVGIFPAMQSYSQDILPPIIASRSTMDGRTINTVRDLLKEVKEATGRMPPFSDLGNACVQYHLNFEKSAAFKESLRMLSTIRTEWVFPLSWKVSLSRSYLSTQDLNVLSGFFFFCLRDLLKTGETSDRNLVIWDTIPLIHSMAPRFIHDKDPDHVIKDVLAHLADINITPPKDTSATWKRSIEDDSVIEFIDSLKEPQLWSPQEDKTFNEDIFNNVFGKKTMLSFSHNSGSKVIHENLIKSIAEENFTEGANRILNVLKTSDFIVPPKEVHELVLGLTQSGKSDKALEILQAIMEKDDQSRVFAATVSHLLGHMISKSDPATWKSFLSNTIQFDKLITKQGVDLSQYFATLSLHLDGKSKSELNDVKNILLEKGVLPSDFTFLEEGTNRNRHSVHSRVVDLISLNKPEEAYAILSKSIQEGEIVYGGTCLQMAGALSRGPSNNIQLLKEFIVSLSEDKVHARQAWNGFFVSLMNHIVDHLDDISHGYTLLEELYEAGAIPSKNCKAYYTTKVGLLIKGNQIDEALDVLLQAGEENALVKNQEMMKIFAEAEDLDKLQKVLDVGISILGEVNALYSLIRCFLDLGKFPQVKKLLETPGFRYVPSNVEYLVEHLIRGENIAGLEHFVNCSRSLFACDRDFLYSKLLSVSPRDKQGEKASEIWINLQEEGHIPSADLKKQIADALHSSGKYVPFSEKSTVQEPVLKPSQDNSLLSSLRINKGDPRASLDIILSTDESERENILSSRQGIRIFSDTIKNYDSESLIALENTLSKRLNKLFFIPRRKTVALIQERKIDLVDSIIESPEKIPSVKVISEVADVDSVRRLYDLRDTFSDSGKAIVVAAALLKEEFSLVREYMNSTDKEERSRRNLSRYIRGNADAIPKPNEFLQSLKKEGLISELGGPIYSYLLEVDPNIKSSKDELSNVILELAKNRVELNSMSTAALRICINHCQDEVMKKNINIVISKRTKAASSSS